MNLLKKIAHSPILNIISGLALLVFASYDVFDIVKETNELTLAPGIGVHIVF